MLLVKHENFTFLDKVISIYIFIAVFVTTSHLIVHFLRPFFFKEYIFYWFIPAIIIFFLSMKKGFFVKRYYINTILLLILFGLIYFLRFGTLTQLIPLMTVIFSIVILIFYKEKYLEIIVKIGTPFFIILLIGAFIGFAYAMAGGLPIFEIENPDGRQSFLFLTTTTNFYLPYINIIRPAGIYDEPGTFSFFLCIFAVFRVLAGKNDTVTFFMLLAGNITFSMVHAIFFLLFNFYMLGKYYKKKIFVIYIVVMIAGTLFLLFRYYDTFDQMLFSRFQGDNLTNNNRSVQIEESVKILKPAETFFDILLFGDPDLEKKEDFIFTNPLGPLVYHGLFISWIYYACMLILIICGILSKKYRFILWAIAAVYAQRPYYAMWGASIALYIIVFSAMSIVVNEAIIKRKKLHTIA